MPEPLRDVIARHGLQATKALGQNFILDRQLLARIAAIPGQLDDAIVYEVGPGPGGLTRALLDAGAKVVAVERAAITFTVEKGKGTLLIGRLVEADMEPYRGPTGAVTTLNESIFSTIPGSPAYVSKAGLYRADIPALNLNVDLRGHNAIQGHFRFEA